jgi:hypothetical protein
MTRWPALAMLVLSCIAGSTTPADACPCSQAPKPCEAYWQADVVFTGTVRSLAPERVGDGQSWYDRSVTTFDVLEVVRGEPAATIPLRSGSLCDYNFEIGQSYVVYAKIEGNVLRTTPCNRTGPLSGAGADAACFRELSSVSAEKRARGWLTGTVYRAVSSALASVETIDDSADTAVQRAIGYPVSLTLTSDRFSLVVESRDARFDAQIPPGGDTVQVRAPDGFYASGWSRFLLLKDGRGCVDVTGWLQPDGHVMGRVVDTDGDAVAGVAMNLVPATANEDFVPEIRARTGDDGRFDFEHVKPGKYRVFPAIPTSADEAAAIARRRSVLVEIGESEREEIGQIRLPRGIDLRAIRGIVVDAAGEPIFDANVWPDPRGGSTGALYGHATTDAEGRFILGVPSNPRFVVHAFRDRFGVDVVRSKSSSSTRNRYRSRAAPSSGSL